MILTILFLLTLIFCLVKYRDIYRFALKIYFDNKKSVSYLLPVPYTVCYSSALGEGFFMCCTQDSTATQFPVDNAVDCWEMFSNVEQQDPDFNKLLKHYISEGWHCIQSKKIKGIL